MGYSSEKSCIRIYQSSNQQNGLWDPVIVGSLANVEMPISEGTVEMQYLTSAVELRFWEEGTNSTNFSDEKKKNIKKARLVRKQGYAQIDVAVNLKPDGTIEYRDARPYTDKEFAIEVVPSPASSSVVFDIAPQEKPYRLGELVVEITDENDVVTSVPVPSVPLKAGERVIINHVANMPKGSEWNSVLTSLCNDNPAIKGIKIVTGSDVTTDNVLVAGSVYLKENGSTLEIHTNKSELIMDTDCSNLFKGLQYIEEMDLRGMNTRKVTNMSGLFSKCDSLKTVNLTSFNTTKVTTFDNMFKNCKKLENLNLSSFVGTNAVELWDMFSNCSGLQSIDLSNFSTPKAQIMVRMFHFCSSLTALDLSALNTENVADFSSMFEGCSNLVDLYISSFKDLPSDDSRYYDAINMFRLCQNLRLIDLSGFTMERASANAFHDAFSQVGQSAFERPINIYLSETGYASLSLTPPSYTGINNQYARFVQR